jgi:hypothetical protein
MIRNSARRNPQQPCQEGDSAPLKLPNAGQRFPENVRRQILGLVPVPHASRDIRVHAAEVLLIEFAKARRVALSGFNPQPVVGALRHRGP